MDRLAQLKHMNYEFMDYRPVSDEQRAVHESAASILVISGGEGSGKSVVTSAEIASRYGTWKRVLLVSYKQDSAQNEADYLYQFLSRFGAVREYHTPRGGPLQLITRDGAVVESVSTHAEGERAVSGTGKSYDIIAMVEAGKHRYSVFQSCLIRIQRTGGLLLLSGTIEKSEPWFPDLIQRLKPYPNELGAQVLIMPTWSNRVDYPGGRQDPKILKLEKELSSTPGLFMERLAGEPAPLASLVFKEFSFLTHVFEWVQFDPQATVEVWVDPGYSGSHYSVNFVQMHPRAYTREYYPALPDVPLTDVWAIGDLYLDHAVHEEVIKVCLEQEPYKTWMTKCVGGVGDIVMKTHPMADRAPVDVWSAKAGIFLRGQRVGIDDGIDRHHTFLRDPNSSWPRLFFATTYQGVREYGRWKRKEVGENVYGEPELKNCDCMKALQYGLIDHFGRVEWNVQPAPVSVGSRPSMAEVNERLPAPPAIPGPVPVASGSARGAQYVVVTRGAPKPAGGSPGRSRRVGEDTGV